MKNQTTKKAYVCPKTIKKQKVDACRICCGKLTTSVCAALKSFNS